MQFIVLLALRLRRLLLLRLSHCSPMHAHAVIPRQAHRTRGYTLIEMLLSLLIITLILAPLPYMISSALAIGAISKNNYDQHARARFAMNRMTQKIATTPHVDLTANASDTTSGTWFTPVRFDLSGTQLFESDASGNRVIANDVTAFSITLVNRSVSREKITVTLTLSNGSDSITQSETVQLGAAL